MKNTIDMKKHFLLRLIVVLFFGCMQQAVSAQEGTWSGHLKLGEQKLQLVFHLQKDSCRMDSPDQGVRGIAVKRNDVPLPTLSLSIPLAGAEYKGVWMGEQIIGTFLQHGYEFPLTLKPGVPVKNRPQTPQGPFPYTCEEVSFANQEALLKGTLTLPANCSPETPVLLMVTGSGLQNRDEEVFEHKPFAVIADALARHGIATLRYDDRGVGESTGEVVNATTETFKKDALAGITFLRKRFKNVGVLGHSEGGTIGLMLAAEKQVDYVISLAGMAISGKETLLEQNRYLLQHSHCSPDTSREYLKILEDLFDQVIKGLTPQLIDSALLPEELRMNLQQVLVSLHTPYMKQFLQLDLSPSVRDITCPVLALNGTKDTQVDCQKNLELLKKVPHSKSQVQACENLNHLFQHCQTGSTLEYADLEETFSPLVLKQMVEWIHAL